MNTRYHYILAIITIIIVYLLYRISSFLFNQFQTDNFTKSIIAKNTEIELRNEQKNNTERYIHTNAYISQITKAMQNKKLPGEEVINVIWQDDAARNIDSSVESNTKKIDDPTEKMTNLEKWQYLWNKWLRK